MKEMERESVHWGALMDLEPEFVNGDRYVRRMIVGINHMVCLVTAKPDWVTPRHQHANDETVYLMEGSMTLTVGDEKVKLEAGDFLYIPPNVPHGGQVGHAGMTQLKVFSPPREDYVEGTDAYLREA